MPADRTLTDGLDRSAQAHPDRVGVGADDGTATFAELAGAARALAAALQSTGLNRGDRVVVFMENSLACAVSLFGVLLAGAVVVSVHPQTKRDVLAFVLADSGARFVISESVLCRIAAEANGDVREPALLVFSRPPADVAHGAHDLDALIAYGPDPEPSRTVPTDLAFLLYTSGSTGRPKGVMHTHQGLVFVIDSIAEYLRLGSEDRILSVLPMSFGYGLSQLLLAAQLGTTLLVQRSFAYPAEVLRRVDAEQVTVFPAIPTVFATLASMFAASGASYPSVRTLTSAAAALPPPLHDPLRSLFPNAALFRMYGMTECIRVCYLEPERVGEKPTSVGKAIPGTEAYVLGDDGEPVSPGETGTLYVRGPHVMPGYWNAPDLTDEVLGEGSYPGDRVLCTNDLFTVDGDGDLYFVARKDEIIKTRGEKVSPAHVESALYALDAVKDAAVVGVPDDLLGEAVRAYIVLADGADVTELDIIRSCRERLESFAVPQQIRFVPDLPKTASGKVRKRSLLT